MRVCLIADARSPIACGWITSLARAGHGVHVISSYPVSAGDLPVASLRVAPIAFGQLASRPRPNAAGATASREQSAGIVRRLRALPAAQRLEGLRFWLGPFEVRRHVANVRSMIDAIRPDIVHAMRIPFEGILAAQAVARAPLLISVWGNDFTLFAERYPPVGYWTQRAMARADAVHADCQRDLELAKHWGFDGSKPAIVLPGGGGVEVDVFHSGKGDRADAIVKDIPTGAPVVINPRGLRNYARTDTFFQAIPFVLRQQPNTIFLCPGMAGQAVAEGWIERLKVQKAVRLLPAVSQEEIATLFRRADVSVSLTAHDGTPNTLLEAMTSGCFPVVGDLESIREWITNGVNGFLCDPSDPQAVASQIVRALADDGLRKRAAVVNVEIITTRAERSQVMAQAIRFYEQVIEGYAGRAASRE